MKGCLLDLKFHVVRRQVRRDADLGASGRARLQ